jgi:hypothetical protein
MSNLKGRFLEFSSVQPSHSAHRSSPQALQPKDACSVLQWSLRTVEPASLFPRIRAQQALGDPRM